MPGFDGTGPAGMGPMTGRGLGYCYNYPGAYGPGPIPYPGYWVPGYGRGFVRGRGFGRGRGFRRGFRPGFGFGYGRGLGWPGLYPAWRGW